MQNRSLKSYGLRVYFIRLLCVEIYGEMTESNQRYTSQCEQISMKFFISPKQIYPKIGLHC
jgi:hypothetical protein